MLGGTFFSAISQILLKQSANIKYSNPLREYLNWRVILAYFLFFGILLLNTWCYTKVDMRYGPVIDTAAYVFVLLLSKVILKEKITPVQGACVFLAFIGCLFVVKPGFQNTALIPALIGVCGGLGAGIAYTMVRVLGTHGIKGPIIVFYFSVCSCLFVLPYLIFNYVIGINYWFSCLLAVVIAAILPIGATEQHAQHLPLCTDAKIAEKFSYYLAKELDGIIMPTLTYGYKSKPLSGGGPLFPGTIDLNGKTVIDLVYDILMELIKDGFTKIFIMNAHFENEAFVVEAMDLVNRDTHGVATIIESNWWAPMPEDVIDKVFDEVPFPGWAFEEIDNALDLITVNGAKTMHIQDEYGLEEGKPANFIVLEAKSEFDAVCERAGILASVRNGEYLLKKEPQVIQTDIEILK